MKSILINNLAVSAKNKAILSSISTRINKGDSVAIIGSSGSGKSILLKAIAGLIEFHAGTIEIENEDSSSVRKIFKTKSNIPEIGFLFQNNALFDSLSVWENVSFGLKILKKENKSTLIAKSKDLLKSVGLDEDIIYKYPNQLSGGMSKRVALARTIALSPTIIFLDEPTTGLDPLTSRKINELIVSLSKKLKTTTITVTHNIQNLKLIANKVIMIDAGKIAWQGKVEDFLSSEEEKIRELIGATTL